MNPKDKCREIHKQSHHKKMLKDKKMWKILKTAREKGHIICMESPIKLISLIN